MKTIFKYSLLSMACLPLVGQAMGINSMMEFTERDKTSFTVTNTANYRQFIQVGITQLDVKDGELVKTPYTRENIDDWSLAIRPARTVIEPKLSKLFQVEHTLPAVYAASRDHAYQLSFIPTPYFEEGEPATHSVKIAVGFAPIVIVPAKQDKPIQYQMRYNGKGQMTLSNHGETYLRASLDACPANVADKDKKTCSTVVYALSGRNLPITLPEGMKNSGKINVELSTHRFDYKKTFTLTPGQTSTNKEG